MAGTDSNNDGFVDRLAKTLFASPNSPFTAFADRQRVERLEACQALEQNLLTCQSMVENQNSDSKSYSIPPSKSAVRIARFFKWRDGDGGSTVVTHEPSAKQNLFSDALTEQTEKPAAATTPRPAQAQVFNKGCSIETHELWACRSLALGCGNFLMDLRRCWENETTQRKIAELEGVTYEHKSMSECRQIQLDMARCVHKNAAELVDRVEGVK